MSPEIIAAAWYGEEDLSDTAAEDSRLCYLMLATKEMITTDDDVCVRGLEHLFMPDFAQRRLEVMMDASNALFDEQDRQLMENSFSEDQLATVYTEASSYARKVARSTATQDEWEAEEISGVSHHLEVEVAKETKTVAQCDTTFNIQVYGRLFSENENNRFWHRAGNRF